MHNSILLKLQPKLFWPRIPESGFGSSLAVLVNNAAKANAKGRKSKAITLVAVVQLIVMMPVEGLGNA